LVSKHKGKCRLRISKNKVQKEIFGSEREEMRDRRRKFHNKALNYFHNCESIIRIMKSKKMRWTGHTGLSGEMTNRYKKFLSENLKESIQL
jgi:hypothetical protein